MTSLLTVRRRAEEFAAAVDGGASAGAHGVEVERLVGVVTVLRGQHDAGPRPEFADALRVRLMTEAEHVFTAENAGLTLPVRGRGTRERRLVAAASAVVLVGGTAGMAAAAQGALPGEALYPIKRGIERVEAGLSMSQAGKGRDLLDQAAGRLAEVEALLGKDSVQGTQQVPETLADFSTQASEGSALLLGSFQETGDPESVVRVRTFAAAGVTVLAELAGDVPPEAQDELAAAAGILRDIDEQATTVCSTCASGMPDLKVPGLILARTEVDRALGQVSSVDLDNTHPFVVPGGTLHAQRIVSPVSPAGKAREGAPGNGDTRGENADGGGGDAARGVDGARGVEKAQPEVKTSAPGPADGTADVTAGGAPDVTGSGAPDVTATGTPAKAPTTRTSDLPTGGLNTGGVQPPAGSDVPVSQKQVTPKQVTPKPVSPKQRVEAPKQVGDVVDGAADGAGAGLDGATKTTVPDPAPQLP